MLRSAILATYFFRRLRLPKCFVDWCLFFATTLTGASLTGWNTLANHFLNQAIGVSKAQRHYFHANRTRLEAQGVDVAGWDRETGDRPLPERIGAKKDDMKGGRQTKRDSTVSRANPKFS
jgi:hypothetical protein